MAKEYSAESIEYALDLAKDRGEVAEWKKTKASYEIKLGAGVFIPTQTFTIKETRAFLIGLVTGRAATRGSK